MMQQKKPETMEKKGKTHDHASKNLLLIIIIKHTNLIWEQSKSCSIKNSQTSYLNISIYISSPMNLQNIYNI